MNREDYKLYTRYPLTDNEYCGDGNFYYNEFTNCQTIVCDTKHVDGIKHCIMTYQNCTIGWGAMAKAGTWYFMIIEKPKND